MGKTIVVASNVPVLVMGAVFREFLDFFQIPDSGEVIRRLDAESRRTLDVRQFDCNDAADFKKIPLFCEAFRPVPPAGNP